MIGAERFGADLATLDQTVELLTQTASTIRDLHDHPGQMRGRALDCGDDELAGAIQQWADAWDWSLEMAGKQVYRHADVLAMTLTTYRALEQEIAASPLSRLKGQP